MWADDSLSVAGICIDPSGIIYVSDYVQHIIVKIYIDGETTVYAGKPGVSGNNGNERVKGSDARFNSPGGLTSDLSGNIYVADTGNNQIRMITRDQYVILVAGNPDGASGFKSAVGSQALFDGPQDVTTNKSGNIFVADTNNHAVRMIVPGISQVSTVAGTGTPGDSYGVGIHSQLHSPFSVVADASGRVLIGDRGNYKIKMLDGNFYLLRYSGSGVRGQHYGSADESEYNDLRFSDVDPSGNLFILDYSEDGRSKIIRVNQNGFSAIVKDYTDLLQGPYVVGVAVNASGHLFYAESNYIARLYSSSSTSSSSSSSSTSSSSSIDSSSSSTSESSSSSSSTSESSSSSSSTSESSSSSSSTSESSSSSSSTSESSSSSSSSLSHSSSSSSS